MSLHIHLFTLFLIMLAAFGLGWFWQQRNETTQLVSETRQLVSYQLIMKDGQMYRVNRLKNQMHPCQMQDTNKDGFFDKFECQKGK